MALDFKQYNRALGRWERKTPEDITRHPNKIKMYKDPDHRTLAASSDKKNSYIGVIYRPECRRPWQARIKIKGSQVLIGYFETDRDAAIAYDKEAIKHGRPTNILKPIA